MVSMLLMLGALPQSSRNRASSPSVILRVSSPAPPSKSSRLRLMPLIETTSPLPSTPTLPTLRAPQPPPQVPSAL